MILMYTFVEQVIYGTIRHGFDKLKQAIYWEPGTTEEQLYSQINRHQFPQIERQAISSRKYVASG